MTAGESNGGELVGKVLGGRYRVTSTIGRGGMGVVARAVDQLLNREVAVKILRAFTDASAGDLADLRVRMQREAQAAARIRHSGVVTVHDVTEQDGLPVIVMELVDGQSLDDVLAERGAIEPHEAAAIGAKLMDALDAAHQAGVLHRDVKPGNVLLERGGRVVLTDFGIASMEAGDFDSGALDKLTRSGQLVGSLDFLPPERAQGREPGPASDIWSLGMTLYAAVEGTSPFRRTSVWSTLAAIVTEPLPEPQRAGVLTPVLRALMAKDPESRPAAAQAREMLERVAAGSTVSFGPPASAAGGAPGAVQPPPPGAGFGAPAAPFPQQPQAGHPAPGGPQVGHLAPGGPQAGHLAPGALQAGHPAPGGPQVGHPAPGGLQVGHPAPGGPQAGHSAPGGLASTLPQPGGRAAGRAQRRNRSRAVIAAVAAAVVLAGGGITYVLVGKDEGGKTDEAQSAPSRPGATEGSDAPSRGSMGGGKRKPSPSSSADPQGKPSRTPSERPSETGKGGEDGKGGGEAGSSAGPTGDADGGDDTEPRPPASPTAEPSSVSKSCSGWSHRNPNPGTYAYLAGDYHLVTGPYQTCSSVTPIQSDTRLNFHCSVVNAHGHDWTYVQVAGTSTSGWMSNDNFIGQVGPSTRC
ncbi:protein kinase [Streptomyces sp. NBC_01381]|uniref:serine/threonine protein kinase n=1 Tax=Streptomyces sp. NBC_01381 TaxID=2903845 RepID=UPI002250D277|nr:serine/threonine protein kinase [Streptomyces sp. NBC_01381]MCX4669558.1 protein kinase [Streptomyces sp. NBC_01381]